MAARKYVLDSSWAGNAFLAPASALSDATNNTRRYYTTSSRKFIDTSMGGHFQVNPLPQFTANCDLKHKSLFSASYGVGRWWSEVLDDNSQQIHIRAGVPKFNSMATFFGNFYNVYAGSVARTGRAPSAWFRVGEVAGFIGTIPFQPFILAGQVIDFFVGMPRSKYYYLKPTMVPYWSAVGSFVNGMFVNLGLSPHFVNDDQKRFFDPLSIPDTADVTSMHKLMPDIVMSAGGIDVHAFSTKAQRLADQYRQHVDNAMAGLTDDPATRAAQFTSLMNDSVDQGMISLKDPGVTLTEWQDAYLAFGGQYDDSNPTQTDTDSSEQSYVTKMATQAKAEARMGSDFVTFRVNNTGSNSDSFSNASTEPSIKTDINAMSSKARMARFNIADGNIGGPIGAVMNAIGDVAKGVLNAAQVEGFIALAGNAFADIQKVYESSSADIGRTTFTIHLRSWAADDWIRLQNLFIPLGAIMALGLPRSTGRSSYDGPFLLEVYNQGRTLIREGLISSISVERGVGDVGFAKGGKVLGIDVNVTIDDLSNVLSIPINPAVSGIAVAVDAVATALGGSVADAAVAAITKSTYGEDNKYTDYLATLASIPLDVQINGTRKWQLNMARTRVAFAQAKSPYAIASGLMSGLTGDLIKAISHPTDRS